MTFENSSFFELKHHKLEMPFGNFYLLEKFFISELNEGAHFDWTMIKSVMDELVIFYGADAKIGYISNRVHSYSINPQTWNKVHQKYHMITVGAIVAYNTITFMNASLENQFSKTIPIKACHSLTEAIAWVMEEQPIA
ncbi:MAG TPA: hypothetical protein PKD13_07135 [Mariniflexile sp.]|nr:hypothetical protein [Mariniflexile sp.]